MAQAVLMMTAAECKDDSTRDRPCRMKRQGRSLVKSLIFREKIRTCCLLICL